MKILILTDLLSLGINNDVISAGTPRVSDRGVAWSAQPASTWEHAFVTGNGRHDTMVPGKPGDERITCVHEELFIRGCDLRIEMPEARQGNINSYNRQLNLKTGEGG